MYCIFIVAGKRGHSHRVWILGSSIVRHAETRARETDIGPDLSLNRWGVTIYWGGHSGLRWESLETLITDGLRAELPPSLIIIHCGGNNIGTATLGSMTHMMKASLDKFMELAPNTLFIFSQILPRTSWRHSTVVLAEKTRKHLNRTAANFVIRKGGGYIKHEEFTIHCNLLSPDGVHPSPLGYDIFLHNLQGGIYTMVTSFDRVFPKHY